MVLHERGGALRFEEVPRPQVGPGEALVTGSRYVTRQELAETIELVRQGKIKPVVTHTFSLEETNRALDLVEQGQVAGRAVVVIPE